MKKIIVVIFMYAIFVSDTFAQTKSVTVYTAGSYVVDDSRKPCYWQGTTRIDLPIPENGSHAVTTSIAVVER